MCHIVRLITLAQDNVGESGEVVGPTLHRPVNALSRLWHLRSQVGCMNAMQKEQLQLQTFASSCLAVTAAVVPVG